MFCAGTMRWTLTGTIRYKQTFIDYFTKNGHQKVASGPLVPRNDPTLMFTNAGMVQFKNVFTGVEKRPYSRAVTSQKCVRAGGKHNDLDNVGLTARHLTFFEMLGSFSFGDYFKKEACRYAFDLMTDGFGFDPERLWYTVHETDDDAAEIWIDEIGVPAERVQRGGKDNFWQMGVAGPAGPSSEIFYDKGPEYGPDGGPVVDEERFMEFWNLVFMQYIQDEPYNVVGDLPAKSIDTGSGLRLRNRHTPSNHVRCRTPNRCGVRIGCQERYLAPDSR